VCAVGALHDSVYSQLPLHDSITPSWLARKLGALAPGTPEYQVGRGAVAHMHAACGALLLLEQSHRMLVAWHMPWHTGQQLHVPC
jgi:hypothetical protein